MMLKFLKRNIVMKLTQIYMFKCNRELCNKRVYDFVTLPGTMYQNCDSLTVFI